MTLDPKLRWLFCPTHPDDELAAAITIRRLTAQGADVWISWTHSNPVREAEGRRAAKLLGIPDDHLIFFGATDGKVCDEMPELRSRFKAMIDLIQPDVVVCGAFEQGHLDHDATHVLLRTTFRGTVYEFPLYHTYRTRLQKVNRFSNPKGEACVHLSKEERAFKTQMARGYPSQNVFQLIVAYAIIHRAKNPRSSIVSTERFRPATHTDFRTPNHPAVIARKVQKTPQWKRWQGAMDRFEGSNG